MKLSWYERNREISLERAAQWRKDHPDEKKEHNRKSNLKKKKAKEEAALLLIEKRRLNKSKVLEVK